MSKYCYFKESWLSVKEWAEWIRKGKDCTHAFCKLCHHEISLGNMGKGAVVKHAAGKKHQEKVRMLHSSSILTYVAGNSTESSVAATSTGALCMSVEESETRSNVNSLSSLNINDATKAEIVWCLKAVKQHWSANSMVDIAKTFQCMFPDSEIAKQFSFGATKAAYTVSHGLAPYFLKELQNNLSKADEIVVYFDEALNKIVQKGQMDIFVRWYNENTSSVVTNYYTSIFLGHCAADDLLSGFLKALEHVPLKKIMQVSMDGPSVNIKFLEKLERHLEEQCILEKILNIGTCGLHVINGAFRSGHDSVGWNIDGLLASLYYLFKDSPVRRAEFIELTNQSIFPSSFCRTRWTENVEVCKTALIVIPFVRLFLEKTKLPQYLKSPVNIRAALSDPFIMAKISFYQHVAEIWEPFLIRYQAPKPMAPFLHGDLFRLIRCVLLKFCKRDIVNQTERALLSIDLDDTENFLHARHVDVGVATTAQLSQIEGKEEQKVHFKRECRKFLAQMLKKIAQRSPLKYKLTQAITAFDPSEMLINEDISCQRMRQLVQILHESNRLSHIDGDKAYQQYTELVHGLRTDERFLQFQRYDERLDKFLQSCTQQKFPELWNVIKKVLILSHGNATVESGFSINKDLLHTNMQEESIIAQRIVFDAVRLNDSHLSIPITKQMMSYVRTANSSYKQHLEIKRKRSIDDQRSDKENRKNNEMIKQLEMMKRRKLQELDKTIKAIDGKLETLRK